MRPNSQRRVIYRHWWPVVTFCPVNHLPDFLWVSIQFRDRVTMPGVAWPSGHESTFCQPPDLYAIRRTIRYVLRWRKLTMEEAAERLLAAFPEATGVRVALAFERHTVDMLR